MQDPLAEIVRRERHPEVAAALRVRASAIDARFLTLVRHVLPKADELTLRQLRNSLPELLEEMADALESTDRQPLQDMIAVSPEHGRTRFLQEFNLGELLMEYHLLRRVMVEEISSELARPLSSNEIEAIHAGIDMASRLAGVEFADNQARQLQASAEAQAKYLSFLSHDLRGGLNSVLLMVEVLRQDLEQAPQFNQSLQDLDLMRRSILDTVATMDRFLDAERLRKGTFEMHVETIELRDLLDQLVREHAPQARQKGLELHNDVPGNAVVRADRNLLVLIMQNLIGNGIKFSRNGEIRVAGQRTSEDVILSVSDQGPGIPAADLEDMFQPFARGRSHRESGTGLGLSIARHAAQLLGGRIWAESKVGRGSTFHVQFPRVMAIESGGDEEGSVAGG
jgi:signal transduction histidine kinase